MLYMLTPMTHVHCRKLPFQQVRKEWSHFSHKQRAHQSCTQHTGSRAQPYTHSTQVRDLLEHSYTHSLKETAGFHTQFDCHFKCGPPSRVPNFVKWPYPP